MKTDTTIKDKILLYAKKQSYITLNQLVDIFSVNKETASVYLNQLVKEGRLYKAGYRCYSSIIDEFKLLENNRVYNIVKILKKEFPFTKFLVWNTQQLQPLYLHTQQNHVTFIETEKEVINSFFDRITQDYRETVLKSIEVDNLRNPVVVRELISRSPRIGNAPKLAKVLVDMYLDLDKHFYISTIDYYEIWEKLFSELRIEIGTVMSYSKWRKCYENLFSDLLNNTHTPVNSFLEYLLNTRNP
jgi:hypothetical protein